MIMADEASGKLKSDDIGVNSSKPEEQKIIQATVPVPPDGGWGWMVVFGSFMIHVIADGVAYSFGIYVDSFLDHFDASRSEIGFLGSLMLGVTWGSGPIASMLTNKYGCRSSAIAGTIIAAFGFVISIFAPNIYFMYFSFGIVAGFGLGMAYLPAIVAVSFYFERRRSLATGLAVCGSGVGTFIFAPLTRFLLDEYGWKGTVLIESGILLNCIFCGAVFRPLPAVVEKQVSASDTLNGRDGAEQSLKKVPLGDTSSEVVKRKAAEGTKVGNHCNSATENNRLLSNSTMSLKTTKQSLEQELAAKKIFTSSGDIKRKAAEGPKIDNSGNSATENNRLLSNSTMSLKTTKQSLEQELAVKKLFRSEMQLSKGSTATISSVNMVKSPMARKDVFYTGSLQNIPAFKSDPVAYRQSMVNIRLEPDASEKSRCRFWRMIGCSDDMMETLRNMMDCRLMINITFQLFAISNLLTSIGLCVPYIFLPDRAAMNGMLPSESAFLISIIGISNTFGRIIFGFLADYKCVNRLMLYNTVLVLCGISSLLSAWCQSYPLMATYAAVFGLLIGVYICLTPIVLVDLLGLEKLSNAFGLVLLYQGIGAVVGPPMAGALYDSTLNYDNSFHLMGICIAVSGAMLYVIPCIQRCKGQSSTSETVLPSSSKVMA